MDLDNFRAQLEVEFEWRTAEVRFLSNTCARIDEEADRNLFRRALILSLYSHFEGYCKFALTLYVAALNEADIQCSQANPAIVAASLHSVFKKLRDSNAKAPLFRNDLPDDSKLHRFALDREFVQRSTEMMAMRVFIPDEAVDTESNLKPIVLKKNLYKLGLPYQEYAQFDGDINKLLELRNKIAHGATRAGVEAGLYDGVRESAFRVMSGVTVEITRAFNERLYLAA